MHSSPILCFAQYYNIVPSKCGRGGREGSSASINLGFEIYWPYFVYQYTWYLIAQPYMRSDSVSFCEISSLIQMVTDKSTYY